MPANQEFGEARKRVVNLGEQGLLPGFFGLGFIYLTPQTETQDKASEETPESAQADTESAAVTIREYEAIAYRQKLRIIYPWNEANSAAIPPSPLIGDQMKHNSTGPACKKCNDTGFIAIWSQNGRYAHPCPVPDDARGYAEARCLECLANPGGFDGPTGAE